MDGKQGLEKARWTKEVDRTTAQEVRAGAE
jgi:hypothetical protein